MITATDEESTTATPMGSYLAGARAMTPFLLSSVPVGIIGGVLGRSSGLSYPSVMALAAAVNSATVQFIGLKLIQQGAHWPVILFTALIVSLRMLIYSTLLAPQLTELSPRWRLILGFGLIDAVFFAVRDRFTDAGSARAASRFYLGASAAMYVVWMISTAIGMAAERALPDLASLGLDFPMTAVFLTVLAASLTNWKVWAAVCAAAATAMLGLTLPYNLSLIVGAFSGAAVGAGCELLERRWQAGAGSPGNAGGTAPPIGTSDGAD